MRYRVVALCLISVWIHELRTAGLRAMPGRRSASTRKPRNTHRSVDAIVSAVVRRHYQGLHECYRMALAQDRSRGGTVFVQVRIGRGDAVTKAKVIRDELKHSRAVACIAQWIKGWSFPGALAAGLRPGSSILLPLTFKADPLQFSVRAEDALSQRSSGAAVQRLLTARNSGARRATLWLLRVDGQWSLGGQPRADRLLYVLNGKGRAVFLGRSPRRVIRLKRGRTVWIPPHAWRSATINGRGLQLVLVNIPLEEPMTKTARSGPHRVVWRDRPRGGRSRRLAATAARRAQMLLDWRVTKNRRFSMGIVSARGGAMPEHAHLGEDELIYVIEGSGVATVDGKASVFGPNTAIYIRNGRSHGSKLRTATTALRVYVPGGPEARQIK